MNDLVFLRLLLQFVSPYSQVFFSVKSVLLWYSLMNGAMVMEWSLPHTGQIYSVYGYTNYNVITKRYKWPRCNTHPYMAATLSCPTGSSPWGVLTSFVLPIHNQGASSANQQGHALRRKFLPATSSFFVTTLLIQTLALQHLTVDASCNGHGCFVLWELKLPFGQLLPDAGYLQASLMHHSQRLL